MAARAPSLFLRAALAVVLTVVFYALALGAIVGLGWLAFRGLSAGRWTGLKLGLIAGVGAAVVLWSILPRFERFAAPGPRLDPGRQPRLFAALDFVARDVGQRMPDEVYLVSDLNAWVAQRPRPFGLAGPRMMGLGLPLLRILSVGEMRAVLAHEFGHFHGGDTSLGPWIYRTRSAMLRTVGNLGKAAGGGGSLMLSLVRIPFLAYAKGFLLLTHAVSRRQELAADALAARVAGAKPLGSGLRKIDGAALAYDAYLQTEVLPALSAGVRPPVADGFAMYLDAPRVADVVARHLVGEMKDSRQDPYDTHPPLAERLAALAVLRDPARPELLSPAMTLLEDLPTLELDLLAHLYGRARISALRPVSWEEVGERVIVPAWGSFLAGRASAFSGWTAEAIPDRIRDFEAVGRKFSRTALRRADAKDRRAQAVGVALGLALLREGFAPETGPGRPVTLHRGGDSLPALAVPADLAARRTTPDEWRETCARLGISDVRLDTGIPAKA